MFIRRTLTRPSHTGESYFTHRLVEPRRVGSKVSEHTLHLQNDQIEKESFERVQDILSFKPSITPYDLTNTCMEGDATGKPKAKRGRSKEKRSDCPLPTLGLVLDASGSIRRSAIIEGNVSGGGTLREMQKHLQAPEGALVIMDAGVSCEEKPPVAHDSQLHTLPADLESVFRSLKSELGMRPVYHHLEDRCDRAPRHHRPRLSVRAGDSQEAQRTRD